MVIALIFCIPGKISDNSFTLLKTGQIAGLGIEMLPNAPNANFADASSCANECKVLSNCNYFAVTGSGYGTCYWVKTANGNFPEGWSV